MTGELRAWFERSAFAVIDELRIPFIATEANGRIAHVNPEFCRAFRTSPERVVGLATVEQIRDAERASFFEHWAAWERGTPRVFRMELPDGAGGSHLFLLMPAPIIDDRGRFHGVVVAFLRVGDATAEIESHPTGLASLARSVLRGIADEVDETLRRADPDLEALRRRVPALSGLSDREWDVARRVARGDRTAMIAADLRIAVSTVRNHLKGIFRKTAVASQSALVERFDGWLAASTRLENGERR